VSAIVTNLRLLYATNVTRQSVASSPDCDSCNYLPEALILPTLGALLLSLREAAGLTQQEVADQIGTNRVVVGRWENDDAVPRRPARARLASLYGVSVERLENAVINAAKATTGRVASHGGDSPTGRDGPRPAWPRSARVFEQELLTEAARRGLDDEELDAIRRALRDVPTAGLDQGGRPRHLSESELMQEIEAIATGLRAWIEVRARRRSAPE
jgi:transcriptional regulator with XRE-family HTH domain